MFYANYLFSKIKTAENLEKLRQETITMEEFIDKMQN